MLDPGLIVLAGGIGRNADLLAGPMQRELAATIPVVPEIVGGHLGEDAVLVGAIATANGHRMGSGLRRARRAQNPQARP